MSNLLGLECFTFNNTGVILTPVWASDPIEIIQEENVNLEMGLADVTTRGANGFRLQRGTLIEGSVDMTILYDTASTDFDLFKEAFFDRTQILLAIVDGDLRTAGSYQGLHSAFNVTNFSQPRPLEEAVTVDITLTLDVEAATDEPPRWDTIVIAGP